MTTCTLCGKSVEPGAKCVYCGRPAPTIITSKGESRRIWDELNSSTRWVILVLIAMAIIGNVIIGTAYVIVGYFWFAPWTADFAKRNNRNKDWGYFWGFLGLLPIAIYWAYVKLT